MFAAGRVVLAEPVDELAEVERRIERRIEQLNMEAVQLGRSMEALAVGLGLDASKIQFRGDLIVFDGRTRSSSFAAAIVDLARIRNVVCTLKATAALRITVSPRSDGRLYKESSEENSRVSGRIASTLKASLALLAVTPRHRRDWCDWREI
jgi:hypothetical protein